MDNITNCIHSKKPNVLILGNDWARMNDLINFAEKLYDEKEFDITFLVRKASFIKRFPKLASYKTIICPAKTNASARAEIEDSIFKRIYSRIHGELEKFVLQHFRHSSLAELFIYRFKKRLINSEIQFAEKIIHQYDSIICFSDNGHESCLGYLHTFKKNKKPIIAVMLLNPAPQVLTVARQKNRTLKSSILSPLSTHITRYLHPEKQFKI